MNRVTTALLAGAIGGSILLLTIAQAGQTIRPFRALTQKQVGKKPGNQRLAIQRKIFPSKQRNRFKRHTAEQSGVNVRTDARLNPVSKDLMGFNMHAVTDVTRSGLSQLLTNAKAGMVRWPGGSQSDLYHWQTHTMCDGWYPHPNSTFDQFMTSIAKPAKVKVAITLNYGTNATCDGGGDPAEAAAWVAHAKSKGYGVKYWTVGNESFGVWEPDLHDQPHDANVYAREVAEGYYPQIKAADSSAKVGVVVNPYDLWDSGGWTNTILRNARYDFVETHFYPMLDASTTDNDLLIKGISEYQTQIKSLQQALGGRNVPILLGEFNNIPTQPNRQTMSIVNALYTGMILAESAQMGVSASFPWELQEDYCTHAPSQGLQPTANFTQELYGWQNFATYSAFSIGLPSQSTACGQGIPSIPFGTPFPAARAATMFGTFAITPGHMLSTSVSSDFPKVRAYSATRGSGFGLLLFNLDSAAEVTLPIHLNGQALNRSVQIQTYGKKQYDQSQSNQWAGPAKNKLGTMPPDFELKLPPWSMSLVQVGG
jgi:hypothetical protein